MIIDMNDPIFKEKIQKKIPQIKRILSNKEIDVYFVPSQSLQELILKNEHPMIKNIPEVLKKIFLEGNGIAIEKKMVFDWIEGKLDAKNSFMLQNGDIRVINNNDTKVWDPKIKKE
jgi:hypothetical protein